MEEEIHTTRICFPDWSSTCMRNCYGCLSHEIVPYSDPHWPLLKSPQVISAHCSECEFSPLHMPVPFSSCQPPLVRASLVPYKTQRALEIIPNSGKLGRVQNRCASIKCVQPFFQVQRVAARCCNNMVDIFRSTTRELSRSCRSAWVSITGSSKDHFRVNATIIWIGLGSAECCQ